MPRLYGPEITLSLQVSANMRSPKASLHSQDNKHNCIEGDERLSWKQRAGPMTPCPAFRNSTPAKFLLAKSSSVIISWVVTQQGLLPGEMTVSLLMRAVKIVPCVGRSRWQFLSSWGSQASPTSYTQPSHWPCPFPHFPPCSARASEGLFLLFFPDIIENNISVKVKKYSFD